MYMMSEFVVHQIDGPVTLQQTVSQPHRDNQHIMKMILYIPFLYSVSIICIILFQNNIFQ